MSDKPTLSRRRFLKGTALGAVAVFAAPYVLPNTVFAAPGRPAPSDRIVMGVIGVGGQGRGHAVGYGSGGLAGRRDVQLVAVCDVDSTRREAVGREVETIYAMAMRKGQYNGCARYNDFYDLLARSDIDAVSIGTPDHWHALIAIAAVKAGKDVYCEKPMTHNIEEGRAMVRAVRRYGAILQTGTQQRSMRDFIVATKVARSGRLGKIKRIEVGLGRGIKEGTLADHLPMPVPDGFDYDRWLGPAPSAPYTLGRCHGRFRDISDYSGGVVCDWGAHHLDIAQWGNGTDRTGPVAVDGRGRFATEGLYDSVLAGFEFSFTYADGVELICSDRLSVGIKFIGTEGWAFCNRGSFDASHDDLFREAPDVEFIGTMQHFGNHWTNFLDGVRNRHDPIAPVEVGHRSASLCHLGNIGMRLGRKLEWDPVAERFVNDAEADRMLARPMRSPWRL